MESERRYRMLAENSIDFVWEVDMDLNLRYASPGVLSLHGYTPEEALEMNSRDFYPPPKIEEIFEKIEKEVLLGAKSKGAQFESVAIHKDGHHFPVEVSGKITFDDNGKPLSISGYIKDITERKNLEKELIKSKEDAEKADKMKSIFLAQMSHEIRTPINAVVSMASLLRYDFDEIASAEQKMSFDVIDRAGGRIIRTVDLLLNLSEIQSGTYEPNITEFDLFADVLSSIVAENRKLAEKRKIKLNLRNTTFETELIADIYTVTQIFVQIIENAIKYTEKGEVNIIVNKNEDDKLVVEVKDTGIGIEKEYLPKLFEPFSQEEMGYTRKFEGNGIGLALVKKYCDLNNANVEVESKKGFGSIFRVIFKT